MYKGLKVITLGPFCASVKELLDMCCSSLLPGGGTNIEFALHCLHEVQGNIMAALDLLLMRGDVRTSWHPLNDYHYTGTN
uniref:Zinc finger protein 541 n=1 Tax=Cyprinus carpio carpio TaxID=630221 RepID=A0A9J8B804_CYPCA